MIKSYALRSFSAFEMIRVLYTVSLWEKENERNQRRHKLNQQGEQPHQCNLDVHHHLKYNFFIVYACDADQVITFNKLICKVVKTFLSHRDSCDSFFSHYVQSYQMNKKSVCEQKMMIESKNGLDFQINQNGSNLKCSFQKRYTKI